MKKILTLGVIACSLSMVSCGPSAEEQAKEAARIKDSVDAYTKNIEDSTAMFSKMVEDSLAGYNKMMADSLAMKAQMDSMAALVKAGTKPASKPKPKTIIPDTRTDVVKDKEKKATNKFK
ncbi:MAG: hypothetical protein IPP29_17920 [Bacteroidetes bacterium]|nr:hypothetical protein [Bacteroidota bacterium]